MKAILVIDVDNIDIKNTQATYIELQCNNQTIQMSLVNHWLRQLPDKLDANDWHRMFGGTYKEREAKGYGYNACLDEILGDTE